MAKRLHIPQLKRIRVYVAKTPKGYLSEAFLKSLDPQTLKKVMSIFLLLDRCPTLRNPERFKQMGIHTWTREKNRHKKIWNAVKPKPIRIACFFHDEEHLVLTHGFIKKDRTWPSKEVERAKNIIEFFYDSHQDKELDHD